MESLEWWLGRESRTSRFLGERAKASVIREMRAQTERDERIIQHAYEH
jgi:hypothetical protein